MGSGSAPILTYSQRKLPPRVNGLDAIEAQHASVLNHKAGYRGHNAATDKSFKVYVAGQKRGLIEAIKRTFRRSAAGPWSDPP